MYRSDAILIIVNFVSFMIVSTALVMQVRVHPRVKKYLDESGEKERLKEGISRLSEDPFTSRCGLGIKKLKRLAQPVPLPACSRVLELHHISAAHQLP
jgi:hypothetical protein